MEDCFIDEWPCPLCNKLITVILPIAVVLPQDYKISCWQCLNKKTTKRKDENSFISKYKNKIKKMVLTDKVISLKDVLNTNKQEAITIAKVLEVKTKDHNSEESIIRRGYKMDGPAEYTVLKVTDETAEDYHIILDRFYTQTNKDSLMSLTDKTFIFKIRKNNNLMYGTKIRELQ